MRKSNSKETRRAVEAYVLEELEAINERAEYDGVLNPARPVSSAFELLKDEMSFQSYYGPASDRPVMGEGLAAKYEAAGRHDHYTAATPYRVMWLYAAIGELEAYTGPIYQRLAEWLDETPEEADRYTDTQAERQFYHMTAAAFERLYNRENTPHRVSTAEFARIYEERNGGHFFDRKTLKFFGQTRKDIEVWAFEFVTDYTGAVHDCYHVWSRGRIDGYRFTHHHYFDRVTLQEVHPAEA